jgi:hypothetical protein
MYVALCVQVDWFRDILLERIVPKYRDVRTVFSLRREPFFRNNPVIMIHGALDQGIGLSFIGSSGAPECCAEISRCGLGRSWESMGN